MMQLAELLNRYRPESWGGTRGDTWPAHAHYLWTLDPDYMHRLMAYMRQLDAWFYKPVKVKDGIVQDGHHRLVIAIDLDWRHRDIPLSESP